MWVLNLLTKISWSQPGTSYTHCCFLQFLPVNASVVTWSISGNILKFYLYLFTEIWESITVWCNSRCGMCTVPSGNITRHFWTRWHHNRISSRFTEKILPDFWHLMWLSSKIWVQERPNQIHGKQSSYPWVKSILAIVQIPNHQISCSGLVGPTWIVFSHWTNKLPSVGLTISECYYINRYWKCR
jgi:hypothetical protein